MPKYVFAYRIQEGDAGSPDAMAQWMAWFEELGAAVVDAGNPVFVAEHPRELRVGERARRLLPASPPTTSRPR